ncbi:MAG: CopG family antitoxin [Candidatus Thioglobus sp.]|uniref:CopG family antitoxin n=1 Tax=Candidatus Thioglobus sp. TaxID=2026721 RepID=UPI00262B9E19|nr:CopG family antitoxin [Candidatus Thioglobus sp.]MDC9726859.1 CopG family antitoxin [Candidatus Thioglobus sp.]
MNKIPKVTTYLDDDEKQLIKAIEKDSYQVGVSSLNEERLKEIQASARAKMNEDRAPISLRIPKTDLSRLKTRAMKEGVPYQTLINSILHKAVN